MIKISKLADYATVIMSFLSNHPGERYSATVIAEHVHIALPTVSKILKMLNDAQLLDSARGINGGYQLARLPQFISVAEVIEAIDGQAGVTECCRTQVGCSNHNVCGLRGNWQSINHLIVEFLSNVSLVDMSKPLHRIKLLEKMSEPQ